VCVCVCVCAHTHARVSMYVFVVDTLHHKLVVCCVCLCKHVIVCYVLLFNQQHCFATCLCVDALYHCTSLLFAVCVCANM